MDYGLMRRATISSSGFEGLRGKYMVEWWTTGCSPLSLILLIMLFIMLSLSLFLYMILMTLSEWDYDVELTRMRYWVNEMDYVDE